MKHKVNTLILSLFLAVSSTVVPIRAAGGSFAEGAVSIEAPDERGFTLTGEEHETAAPDTDLENEELYEEYLTSLLYENEVSFDVAMYQEDTGKTTLNENNYKVYRYLREYFAKVASAEETSTQFQVDFESLGLQTTFTREELGVEAIVVNDEFTSEAIAAFKSKLKEEFSLTNTVVCLLQDAPYDMYWYDKKKGADWTYSYAASTQWNSQTSSWDYESMTLTNVTMKFYVAPGYNADSTYLALDPTVVATAKKAAANAQAIVDQYASKSDYEKILAYKEKVLDLASYDTAAAAAGSVASYGRGDPWQLIWVFDGDTSTKVVCEGYCKAFQYLCELSSFRADIYCYTVSGTMRGGEHMWNIIRMDDGGYYLADLTNSDAGMIGQSDGLFLRGAASGSPDQGYIMYCGGANASYVYDAKTKANNLVRTLTISLTDYQGSMQEEIILGDMNRDGQLTNADVAQLLAIVTEGESEELSVADLNGDGIITNADVAQLLSVITAA